MSGFNTDFGGQLFSRNQPGGLFAMIDPEKFPGKIFYVDSNNGTDQAGSGRSPADPVATIDFAIGLCTDSEGDVILVAPAHAETLTTLITLDVIGVGIFGLTRGTLRPQITINANIDGIDITAANCRVSGLYFNEGTNAHTSSINVAAAGVIIDHCHFDMGVNDLESITVASGIQLVIEDCTGVVSANGPDAWVEIEGAGVDQTTIRNNEISGSDGSDAFDAAIINSVVANSNLYIHGNTFSGDDISTTAVIAASVTGLVVGPNSYGGSAINADNAGEMASIGAINDTTSDSLHGKLGTDTELADRSMFDLLVSAGPASYPSAAAPANDVSLGGVLRAIYNLVTPVIAIGEADIDEDQAVYTAYVNLITIVPSVPLSDCRIVFDMDKDTTGWADKGTTETLKLRVARKIDGTNWVGDTENETAALIANNADGVSLELVIGDVGVTEEVRIEVILSADPSAGDVEIPFAFSYKALVAPTITPVAIA